MSPTTEQRANRIPPVLDAHAEAQRAELPPDTPMADVDTAAQVQDLLSDLVHFCDQQGLDFDDLLHLSDLAYRQELEGPSPLPLPDPLIQPRT